MESQEEIDAGRSATSRLDAVRGQVGPAAQPIGGERESGRESLVHRKFRQQQQLREDARGQVLDDADQ